MEEIFYFKSIGSGQVDKENGEITGVSVISTPEAKGHGLKIDGESIKSFLAATEGKQIKAYYTHEDNEALDSIGLWDNFKIVEDDEYTKLTADFSALNSWKEHHQAEYDAFFELAEKAPEAFGVSAEFTGETFFYQDGEAVNFSGQEGVDEIYARALEVSAFSIVAEPAANPTGLFSIAKEEEVDHEEFLSFNLNKAQEENESLKLELEQTKETADLLNKKADDLELELNQLTESLAEAKAETIIWQAKFGKMQDDLGAEPLAGQVEVETLSIEDQVAKCNSWTEKGKMINDNMSYFLKNWNK
tara:strand:+ start:5665 stop:6573 length:909 start_codon:yes stop_codon:yes gene_type:complete